MQSDDSANTSADTPLQSGAPGTLPREHQARLLLDLLLISLLLVVMLIVLTTLRRLGMRRRALAEKQSAMNARGLSPWQAAGARATPMDDPDKTRPMHEDGL